MKTNLYQRNFSAQQLGYDDIVSVSCAFDCNAPGPIRSYVEKFLESLNPSKSILERNATRDANYQKAMNELRCLVKNNSQVESFREGTVIDLFKDIFKIGISDEFLDILSNCLGQTLEHSNACLKATILQAIIRENYASFNSRSIRFLQNLVNEGDADTSQGASEVLRMIKSINDLVSAFS